MIRTSGVRQGIVRVAATLVFAATALGQMPLGSWVPTLPDNTTQMFTPIAGFPRQPHNSSWDPEVLASGNPMVRQSGVFGFTDTMASADPNDDREYFIPCRSDGIYIADATPQSGTNSGVQWSQSASDVMIPASNKVSFVPERDWGYLGPRPVGADPSIPELLDLGKYRFMNGYDLTMNPAAPTYPYNPNNAYDSTTTFPYPYTTKNTTNREAVAWFDPPPTNNGQGRWCIYSISTLHPGIWVIPLRRNTTTSYHYLEPDPALPDYWWTGVGILSATPYATGLGRCHMIYLDAERRTLWVTDDDNGATFGVEIGANGSPMATTVTHPTYGVIQGFVMDYRAKTSNGSQPLGAHDAMPVGDRLFISMGGVGRIDVLNLPISNPVPIPSAANWIPADFSFSTPYVASGHSAYFDETAAPTSDAWLVGENNTTTNNIARFSYVKADAGDSATFEAVTQAIQPIGFSAVSAVGHHVRGLGRTGVVPNYNNGFSLVSLVAVDGGEAVEVLGSFDTAFTSLPISGNFVQQLVDSFLGTWDVFLGAGSGVMYVSGGALEALVFRPDQGLLNRYWRASPFAGQSAAAGMFPVIVNPYGPPRVGESILLRDANAGKYPTQLNGQAVTYRYTLCYSNLLDPISPDSTWAPSFVSAPRNPATGDRNLTSVFTASTNTIGNDTFFLTPVGVVGDKRFLQMVVEEIVAGVPTGRWAASRGTWFGIAP